MTDGDGYWLNPHNGAYLRVVRHELTMSSPAALERLGVADEIIHRAQQISPFNRAGEQALRTLGIAAGLVRIRDHGDLITVQFAAAPMEEANHLRKVLDFLRRENQWRPLLKVGNFRTETEVIMSWAELESRASVT